MVRYDKRRCTSITTRPDHTHRRRRGDRRRRRAGRALRRAAARRAADTRDGCRSRGRNRARSARLDLPSADARHAGAARHHRLAAGARPAMPALADPPASLRRPRGVRSLGARTARPAIPIACNASNGSCRRRCSTSSRQSPHAQVRFASKVEAAEDAGDHVRVEIEADGKRETLRARYVVGADGARSTVRHVAWGCRSRA